MFHILIVGDLKFLIKLTYETPIYFSGLVIYPYKKGRLRMNVLLVDDEKKFVMLLAKRLELRGFQVSFVNSGMDAIQLIKKGNKFNVAVLDVKMPGIGGIELRRELQKLDSNMKFIFLTEHGSQDDYAIGIKEATRYLPKPLKIEVFVETLLEVAAND